MKTAGRREAIVRAEGAMLEEVCAMRSIAGLPLDARGCGRLQRALRASAWGSCHQDTLALLIGGAMVASAERFHLAGYLDQLPIRICALGSVLSHSTSAESSASLALVQQLAEAAIDSGTAVLLFSPRDRRPLLAKSARLITSDLTLQVAQSTRHGAPMTTVRSGEERDLEAIAAMGRTRASSVRFHIDRDVDFVRYAIARKRLLAGLAPPQTRELAFFIAEEGITAAAYVVLTMDRDGWSLEECGDRDPSGARVGALLQALIAREPAERRPAITGWLPSGFLPPQIAIEAATPSATAVDYLLPGQGRDALAAGDSLYWRADCL